MEKKEYIAPKLEIVEISHHAPLLDGSCTDGDKWAVASSRPLGRG